MRGIGAGQKIHVLIIPEVVELMHRELKNVSISSSSSESSVHVLENIAAWLIINSLRSEQVQWTMLCIQNVSNLYRKNAFACVHSKQNEYLEEKSIAISKDVIQSDPFISNLDFQKSLSLFNEDIDFSLEAGVPDPVPFEDKLRSMMSEQAEFIKDEQHDIGHEILVEVGQFAMVESCANRLESEQEREQV